MIEMEQELRKSRHARLKASGLRGFSLTYPAELANSLGLKAGKDGTEFEVFTNHKGEFLARPVTRSEGQSGNKSDKMSDTQVEKNPDAKRIDLGANRTESEKPKAVTR